MPPVPLVKLSQCYQLTYVQVTAISFTSSLCWLTSSSVRFRIHRYMTGINIDFPKYHTIWLCVRDVDVVTSLMQILPIQEMGVWSITNMRKERCLFLNFMSVKMVLYFMIFQKITLLRKIVYKTVEKICLLWVYRDQLLF